MFFATRSSLPPRRASLLTLGIVAMLMDALAVRPLYAYEYHEHCMLSNQGLRIAVAYVRQHATPTDSVFLDQMEAGLRRIGDDVACSGHPKHRSYGDLVARVDLARSPAEYYFGFSNPAGLTEVAVDSIPWKVIERMSRSRLRAFRAMHENQDHFAPRALLAFHQWHTLGIHLAANGRLASALLVNAFADHYLQDHFAPGHIYTPRQGLNDALSVGIHDHYNHRGARYLPRRTSDLARLVPADRFHWDHGLAGIVERACGNSPVYQCLQTMERRGIILRGDGQLERMPEQRLYLTLIAAQSALDVIESARAGRDRDSFGIPEWVGYHVRGSIGADERFYYEVIPPVAAIAFGVHDSTSVPRRVKLLSPPKILPLFDRPVILTYGLESFPASAGDEFSVLSLETILFETPGEFLNLPTEAMRTRGAQYYQNLANLQPAILGGVDIAVDPGVFGMGPTLRYLFPVTAINAQFSLDTGLRWYPHAEQTLPLAFHAGGTVTIGFGLVHLGTRIGVGQYVTQEGRFGPEDGVTLTVRPVINVILPVRRKQWPEGSPDVTERE